MALVVSVLESQFTGDPKGFDQAADHVETRSKQLEDARPKVEIDADVHAVLAKIGDVESGVGRLESSRPEVVLDADVKDVLDTLAEVEKVTKDLDGEKIDIDVDIDKERSRPALSSFKDDVAASGNESGQELAGSMMDGFNGENVVEALTEVVAEATEGMSGPMQAAGIGLAIVLALAYAEMAKVAEAVNEAKEAGGEWSESFNTADLSGRLEALREKFQTFATEITDTSEWYEFGEAAETALEQIVDGADEGGVSVRDFMAAFNEEDPTRRLELLQEALQTTTDRTTALRDEANSEIFNFAKSWDVANSTRELGEQSEAIEDLVREQEIALQTEAAMADAMGVTIDQFRNYNELSDEAKERIDGVADADKGAAIEAEVHAEARAELNDELEDGIDASRNLVKATWGLQDAEKGLNEVIADGTKKGRDAKEALFDYSGAAIDAASAAEDASGKTQDYNRVIGENRRQFIRAAEDMGYTRGQARRLADQYGLIPKDVATEANLQDNASAKARGIKGEIDAIPSEKTIRITSILDVIGEGRSPYVMQQRAAGGPVWPGEDFLVGEEGPELVRFSQAGTVVPAAQTAALLASSGGNVAPSSKTYAPVINHHGDRVTSHTVMMAMRRAELLDFSPAG